MGTAARWCIGRRRLRSQDKIRSGGVRGKTLMTQRSGGVVCDFGRDLIIPRVGSVGAFTNPTNQLPHAKTTQGQNRQTADQKIGVTPVMRQLGE